MKLTASSIDYFNDISHLTELTKLMKMFIYWKYSHTRILGNPVTAAVSVSISKTMISNISFFSFPPKVASFCTSWELKIKSYNTLCGGPWNSSTTGSRVKEQELEASPLVHHGTRDHYWFCQRFSTWWAATTRQACRELSKVGIF